MTKTEPPLQEWQKSLLDERLQAAEEQPNGWLTWDQVKRRVFGDRCPSENG